MVAADAKLKVLESYDSGGVQLQSTGNFVSQIQGDGMNAYFESYVEKSPVEFTRLGAVPKTSKPLKPLQRIIEEEPKTKTLSLNTG